MSDENLRLAMCDRSYPWEYSYHELDEDAGLWICRGCGEYAPEDIELLEVDP